MANQSSAISTDILEIVFAKKNKEYGSYYLRKNYSKYVTWATWIAVIVFTLAVSSPFIIKMLKGKEEVKVSKVKIIQYTDLAEPPSIDKTAPPPVVEAAPQLKATIKFFPPVVKPDEKVTDEYVPTVDELKKVDPGTKTEEGHAGGTDYSLIEVAPPPVEEKKPEKEPVYTFVEEMPTFPGGEEALLSFLASNIKYPEIARRAGVEGRIYAQFTVSSSGAVKDPAIIKGIGAGCDEEALRVISRMPKWKPGKQNGNSVSVRISVPIVFKIQ